MRVLSGKASLQYKMIGVSHTGIVMIARERVKRSST